MSLRSASEWIRTDKGVLAVAATVFSLLGFLRGWLIWNTGVIVSDEFGYIASAWAGQSTNSILGFRDVFGEINILLFRVFGLGNIDRLTVFMPFYVSLWSFTTLVALWMTLRVLGFGFSTRTLVLFFFAATPTFLFLSAGFLSEPMALAFATLGTYFLVRCLKKPGFTHGVVYSLASVGFFWLSMHSREPYSLLIFGGFVVLLAQSVLSRGDRRKLLTFAAIFLLCGAGLTAAKDPIFIEAMSSIAFPFHQIFIQPIISAIKPPPPGPNVTITLTTLPPQVVTTTTTSVVTITGPSGPVVTTTTEVVTTTVTGTASQTAALGVPPVIQTQGILAFLGITTVPANGLYRALLLIFLAITTGYGPVGILLAGSSVFVLYEILRREDAEERLVTGLLALFFLGTLGGVVLVFVYQPSYFDVQHYSTLLRFASTSLLMFPLVLAPFFEKATRSRRAKTATVVIVLAIYAISAPTLVYFAQTNLPPSQQPFTLSPPAGFQGEGIALRGFIQSHPGWSEYVVIDGSGGLLTWIPGLSARSDVVFTNFLNDSQMEASMPNEFLVYLTPLSPPPVNQGNYNALYAIVSYALNGTRSSAAGFHAVSVVYRDAYGSLVEAARN